MKKFLEKFYLVLIFIFLYAPILTLIVLSFNESRSMGSWSGFTLKWYAAMLQDETMMEALKNTLVIALVSAVTATLIGTLNTRCDPCAESDSAFKRGYRDGYCADAYFPGVRYLVKHGDGAVLAYYLLYSVCNLKRDAEDEAGGRLYV